jgi:TfoX/Sxy family transcriptional regulator of competence genes
MAYDEGMAVRIREVLDERADVVEKKMFGGIAFMVQGNMCVGVIGDNLMVRVGPDQHAEALAQPHARPMDFTNRPMKGFVYVDPAGLREDADLAAWIERGLTFVLALPPK